LPPTTRRVTVEVFDPAFTRVMLSIIVGFSLYILGSDLTENKSVAQQWICANHIENTASTVVIFTAPLHINGSYPIVSCVFVAAEMCLLTRCLAMDLRVTILKRCILPTECICVFHMFLTINSDCSPK
jgi:hypothetical protein